MPTAREVLIVEPEDLIRWSLVTYLRPRFQVHSAESKGTADKILEEHTIDVLIVSDDLSNQAADEIEHHAHSRNPSAQVVRLVTDTPADRSLNRNTLRLEKPFDLSSLGRLLGAETV